MGLLAIALSSILLAGCATSQSPFSDPFSPAASAPPPAPKPVRPAINMAGRWTLASPQGGMCVMNFGGKPGSAQGTIAPEGGCPGQFFTSRHWQLGANGLAIIDHKEDTLAQLAVAGPGRFEGRAGAGMTVTLSR